MPMDRGVTSLDRLIMRGSTGGRQQIANTGYDPGKGPANSSNLQSTKINDLRRQLDDAKSSIRQIHDLLESSSSKRPSRPGSYHVGSKSHDRLETHSVASYASLQQSPSFDPRLNEPPRDRLSTPSRISSYTMQNHSEDDDLSSRGIDINKRNIGELLTYGGNLISLSKLHDLNSRKEFYSHEEVKSLQNDIKYSEKERNDSNSRSNFKLTQPFRQDRYEGADTTSFNSRPRAESTTAQSDCKDPFDKKQLFTGPTPHSVRTNRFESNLMNDPFSEKPRSAPNYSDNRLSGHQPPSLESRMNSSVYNSRQESRDQRDLSVSGNSYATNSPPINFSSLQIPSIERLISTNSISDSSEAPNSYRRSEKQSLGKESIYSESGYSKMPNSNAKERVHYFMELNIRRIRRVMSLNAPDPASKNWRTPQKLCVEIRLISLMNATPKGTDKTESDALMHSAANSEIICSARSAVVPYHVNSIRLSSVLRLDLGQYKPTDVCLIFSLMMDQDNFDDPWRTVAWKPVAEFPPVTNTNELAEKQLFTLKWSRHIAMQFNSLLKEKPPQIIGTVRLLARRIESAFKRVDTVRPARVVAPKLQPNKPTSTNQDERNNSDLFRSIYVAPKSSSRHRGKAICDKEVDTSELLEITTTPGQTPESYHEQAVHHFHCVKCGESLGSTVRCSDWTTERKDGCSVCRALKNRQM